MNSPRLGVASARADSVLIATGEYEFDAEHVYLQKAEAAGEAEAAVLLGRMYLQGDGVAKDTGLALQGLRRTILVTPVSARRARAQMLQSKDTADA